MMRTNLHIHFHCSNCGAILKVPMGHEIKEGVKAKQTIGQAYPAPETGAACNQQTLFIEPCKACITRVTAPAQKIVDAIREMGKT